MLWEIHLEGAEAPLICRRLERPDIVQLGSGELFKFFRFCAPHGTAKRAALYRPATVEEFVQVHLSRE